MAFYVHSIVKFLTLHILLVQLFISFCLSTVSAKISRPRGVSISSKAFVFVILVSICV